MQRFGLSNDNLLFSEYFFEMDEFETQVSLFITIAILAAFAGSKAIYDRYRKSFTKIKVVVVGAGPIGLTSAIIALRSTKVSKITIFEEKERNELIYTSYQISFDDQSIQFLKSLGVDFDNIEGCWKGDYFQTNAGVYMQYILEKLKLSSNKTACDIHFKTRFCRETLKDIEGIQGRCLVITSDGRNGQAQRILGLNDFSEQYSCGAFGTVAAVERADLREIPTPEIRVHNLNFDLSAYGGSAPEANGTPGFSLKIFGNSKHRFISLAIAKCDLPVVKALRTILDRAMMRNIFLKCFNTYKLSSEPLLSESYALNHMKYSPRLFEIKLSQRSETVAYFDDCDMFVLAEGEAAAFLNFHTGLDINPAIRGLTSLGRFIEMITVADTEHAVSNALMYKMKHSEQLFRDFVKNGIREYMLT
ncbi:uncharacterized protein [Mytilus edulis]|uniref:uncharacterized protein isoform X2 n=1 Tax=Mytilus edulis TaxID=6550 RepID=UPI0039EF65B0